MTRIAMLLLGALATVTFAAAMLVIIPQIQLARITQPALLPYTESQQRGRDVYVSNGCIYCHSQQIRDPIISTDVQRGWGRPSYPSDYYWDEPALLGTMRTGPDLINVGSRIPDRNWHLVHLYNPRALVPWSIMPSHAFLFEEKDHAEVRPQDEVLKIPEAYAPKGKSVVVTADAHSLVDYLLSLKRDFPPPEEASLP
jgi:cytochrome c oxidase cbb3-type subunit 2